MKSVKWGLSTLFSGMVVLTIILYNLFKNSDVLYVAVDVDVLSKIRRCLSLMAFWLCAFHRCVVVLICLNEDLENNINPIQTAKEKLQIFKNAIVKIQTEKLNTCNEMGKKEWMTKEILELKDKRRT